MASLEGIVQRQYKQSCPSSIYLTFNVASVCILLTKVRTYHSFLLIALAIVHLFLEG